MNSSWTASIDIAVLVNVFFTSRILSYRYHCLCADSPTGCQETPQDQTLPSIGSAPPLLPRLPSAS